MRILVAMKSSALLNESVGAGYIDRNWPPALKESGGWPLASLRQSFLNGSLTRLLDPDATLRGKIAEFVERGDFGLASGQKVGGGYERIWYQELIAPAEVEFDPGVFLLTKAKAKGLKGGILDVGQKPATEQPVPAPVSPDPVAGGSATGALPDTVTIRLRGDVPPESWNRLGTKILPKLRAGSDVKADVVFSVRVSREGAESMISELRLVLDDLGLIGRIRIEKE
jgi:hypothetical protein